ncbi:NAD(P)/FAD-dependent oxidoreductase [Pseudomonas sp. N3-W]|uniref:FAD/NAD(P)-binding oxidoreductase n=1 Tax=Pseudomonas fungipugnans TaxID=3024217 RepID=A0ABT6QJM4_9PSED|nr:MULTISPECIES: FAD/NAD(P)-binding oxidoreductase [unclassified Pseudomonas]MDI2591069.1 FAD/NAD(P)-binding oxidoreductase [Pseudomonas sp. 681]UWF47490.1 NAD(P)/FAD-dependent oxidoreductase [Pseudomonas sp. N3-W]
MSMMHVDLLIIGAGPAGMSCALQAREAGLDVLLVDENQQPGGQIYRSVAQSPLADPDLLGKDYVAGAALVKRFLASGVAYWPGTLAWQITRDRQVSFTRNGANAGSGSGQIQARALVIANGAQERPVPFPGWTLPGVMGIGAAQTLLKSAALLPSQRVVLAGSGPLLYLFAWQLIRSGSSVAAILDTTPRANRFPALRHLFSALRAPGYLLKGMDLLRTIRSSGLPHIRHVDSLEALGQGAVERVRYAIDGREAHIDTDLLLVHQGVIPNVQLTRSLGCEHLWDATQLCWRPDLDQWGQTSLRGTYVAGDGGGIDGARVAEFSGALTALQVAQQLGCFTETVRDRQALPLQRQLNRHRAIRPFLDTLYRPAEIFRRPADQTIVCRCEEVSAGDIRAMSRLGCSGPNQTKSFSRCGMGPCQGRMCGITVGEILAEARHAPMQAVGYYRIRPPIKPVQLIDLANAYVPDVNAAPLKAFVPK